jgi:L-ascorbate metabolism protein UlaG (beta-lactamase superfamily)
MEITWLGHSSVRINSRDIILVTDPYDTSEGNFMPPQKADIVTVSNDSPKHSHTSSVTGNPHLIHGPGEYEISHFYVTGTGTAIDEGEEAGGRVNTFYTIRAEGLTLCHLGALTRKLTPAQLDRLRQTQILIAPVSGEGILPTTALQEIISSIQPRVLIPVQYGDGGPEELESVERFLTNMGVAEPPPSSNRLTINETNLPADMRINLLNRQI